VRLRVAAIAAISLSTIGAALGSWDQGAHAQAGRPDIIVVMVDDLGFLPDDRVLKRLPNLRRTFLDRGMRVSGMHSETPICCPGRASFQTGQHTLRHGVFKNDGDLLDARSTFNLALHEAGYHTIFAGKYYNSYSGTKVPPGWDHVAMAVEGFPSTFHVDGQRRAFRGMWKTEITARHATRWLDDAPLDRPVHLWASFNAPHINSKARDPYAPFVPKGDRGARTCSRIDPFKPPTYTTRTNALEAKYPMPKWASGWNLHETCESLLVVDRAVGKLVKLQRERGREGYFVFMSDNGMSWGQRGFAQKNVPTSARLPFYIMGPGIRQGTNSTWLASNIDIAPTLMEIADVGFPSADGHSFLAGLKERPFDGREHVLFVKIQAGPKDYVGWRGVKSKEWFYVAWDNGKRELYSMKQDQWLRRNVARQQQGVVTQLDALLDRRVRASRR
jgi:N-acetylglucosamine-6-sulfatase